MTGPFRNHNPFYVPILLLYGLLLRAGSFLRPFAALSTEADGWLYTRLFGWALPPEGQTSMLPAVAAGLLTFVQALMLNGIVNRERLLGQAGHLTAMAYLLVTSLIPEWWALSSPMVATTLLIPALGYLNSIFNNPRPGRLLFNAGILIGIAALFHQPAVLFIALVFTALFTMGASRAPDWLAGPIGLLMPFYFLLSWLYLNDRWGEAASLLPRFGFFPDKVPVSPLQWAGPAYMIVLVLFGIWQIQAQLSRMLIRNRKVWNILSIHLFIAFAVPFLTAPGDATIRFLAAPPLAAFHAMAFSQKKPRWMPEALHVTAWVIALVATLGALSH